MCVLLCVLLHCNMHCCNVTSHFLLKKPVESDKSPSGIISCSCHSSSSSITVAWKKFRNGIKWKINSFFSIYPWSFRFLLVSLVCEDILGSDPVEKNLLACYQCRVFKKYLYPQTHKCWLFLSVCGHVFVESLTSSALVFQGPVHHRSSRRGEAHECERPAGGPLRGGDPPSGQGLPVCGDARRGLSGQLDPRVSNGELFVILWRVCNAESLN